MNNYCECRFFTLDVKRVNEQFKNSKGRALHYVCIYSCIHYLCIDLCIIVGGGLQRVNEQWKSIKGQALR